MKAKKLFFTATIAMLAIFSSSCDNDDSLLISALPFNFNIHIVDENGNSLITPNNLEVAENNIYINYEDNHIFLNKENDSNKTFNSVLPQHNVLRFGSFAGNCFNGSFTINYGDGTSDEITYVMKNYEHLDKTRSVKVYINGTQIKSSNYSVNITIVKPDDFLEN